MNDDLKLISAFKEGDRNSFEKIVRKYQNKVANVVYLILGKNADVEDIVQEVFIKVYHSLVRYEPKVSFYSWLYRITVNLCIDELRKKKIRRILTFDFLTDDILMNLRNKGEEEPDNALLIKEKQDIISNALQNIPPSYRVVLIMREYDGMSYQEIATVLNLSVQAVKSRIFRARKEMKKLLANYFGYEK